MNALTPLSWVYGAGVATERRARMAEKPARERPHIVSIGNLEAGGNGKTPLAIWMLERAAAEGKSCAYVSRGYGGRVARDVVTCVFAPEVAPTSLAGMRVLSHAYPDLARVIGDEGALVCERAPDAGLFFCADKVRAVDAAISCGVELIVLDDAFQSWRVPRHTDIVLLDAAHPLDGGQLLPAGRLRETPDALSRADAIVFNGADTPAAIAAARLQIERWLRPGAPVLGMGRRVELAPARGDSSRPGRFLAISGIARPQAYEQSLCAAGIEIAEHAIFPDHHRYGARDIETVIQRARGARVSAIVTTEKDWVKLRRFQMPLPVWIARLEVFLTGDELPR